jgi:hypothetical protein
MNAATALPRLSAVAAFLGVAVAGALAALAGSGAADAVRPAEPASPPGRVVSVGPARLVVPADWRAVSPSSAGVPAPDGERAAVFAPASRPGTRVVAAFEPTVGPSLVPDGLRTVGGRAPTLTRVRGWPAWIYDAGQGGSVTTVATTTGALAIACTGAAGVAADPDCASDVESVAVPGARALVPSRSLALELHLPAVLDRLNRARSEHRARLGSARTSASQALAAGRLDADHRAAARSLRRLGGPAAAPLIGDLTDVADAYGALARAARDVAPGDFTSAAIGVRHTEAVLAGAVAAVSRPETMAVAARVAMPQPGPDGSPPGVPTMLFALLIGLAMTAGVAAGSSDGASQRLRRLFGVTSDACRRSRWATRRTRSTGSSRC